MINTSFRSLVEELVGGNRRAFGKAYKELVSNSRKSRPSGDFHAVVSRPYGRDRRVNIRPDGAAPGLAGRSDATRLIDLALKHGFKVK